jgi:hypothetical protein
VRGQTFYPSISALRTDFDHWLARYDAERPHRGYRNWGRTPLDLVNRYLATRQADA